MQDPYANFVIQTALSESKGRLHEDLVEAIKPYLPSLRGTPFGKVIHSDTSLLFGAQGTATSWTTAKRCQAELSLMVTRLDARLLSYLSLQRILAKINVKL